MPDELWEQVVVRLRWTSGCAWRYLPESFGVSPATAHRRFTVWTEAGLWRRLHRAVLIAWLFGYRRLTTRYERNT